MSYQILYKIEEVRRIKQVKQFYEELQALEEVQTNAILRLMKAKKLIETIVHAKSINKESINSPEIKNYKRQLTDRMLADFKNNNLSLIGEKEDLGYYQPKKKKTEKEAKKPTTQITYELWVEKNSIEEIALLRKLTVGTIMGHLTKLIQDKAVAINDVLPQDKIDELSELFKNYKEDSLNPLKEKVGDQFSWDELRMFKASLN